MQKVMVTGSGMVATALANSAGPEYEVKLHAHSDLDVTDAGAVLEAVSGLSPDIVFHTAALTRVNYCEQTPALAMRVNAAGTKNVVDAARGVGARLVYFSTDYVFNGKSGEPYKESDTTDPVNEYGKSKLAGEQFALDYENAHVVRTSGVFGPRSDGEERNFIRAIFEQLKAGAQPDVVDDLVTSLTYAPALGQAVWRLIPKGMPKVVHLAGSEVKSWYGWACKVSELMGRGKNSLQPVPSKTGGTGTPRPPYSVLKSEWAEAASLIRQFDISKGIAEYISGLA